LGKNSKYVEPIIHRIIDEMEQKRGSGNRSRG
jgi:hypothetical protein